MIDQGVNMPGVAIIGAQWGDEGKGKVVDALANNADFVVRYSGGANAGHTIVVGNDVFKLHHLPCGVLTTNLCPFLVVAWLLIRGRYWKS